MPEQESTTAIVPVTSASTPGQYQISVKEVDAGGNKSSFDIALPDTRDWKLSWGVLHRAALAKKGSSQWGAKSVAEIINAIIYADSLGLSFEQGDVYSVDGRLNTTADAKIKYALNSGKIGGYEIQVEEIPGKPLKLKYKAGGAENVYETSEYVARVTVTVKGWEKPFVYEAYLSEWFQGSNPNWRTRPKYMLGKNATSKALTMVAPMGGVGSDEAPE